MAKTRSLWSCVSCGHTQPKWSGQCSACQEWNTYTEELQIQSAPKRFDTLTSSPSRPLLLSEIEEIHYPRVSTLMEEFDRVLGGGLVAGSLILVGGDPGIGKSTLMLQVSHNLSKQGKTVLYVCGEESAEQTSLRARRLRLQSSSLFILSETLFSAIRSHIEKLKPDVLIIDSVQIVYKGELSSAPGTVSQVREIATECMHIAKGLNISTFLIGHVTKTGDLAGPKVLEHLVDTVLDFEGDRQHGYRMLRAVKNRFGPTDEIALFQMQAEGLTEVAHPSALFLEERKKEITGSVIIPTVEGSRPLLIEVQALVASSAFSTCTRRSTGIDSNRLALLLAVLEKRMGYPLHHCDVFVSVAGGFKISEPAADLGVLLAVASSFCNWPIDPDMVVLGEVGLGGEVRSVPRVEGRLKEALHMGFTKCVLPKRTQESLEHTDFKKSLSLRGVDKVEEAIDACIGASPP